jgi:hypothetical protein
VQGEHVQASLQQTEANVADVAAQVDSLIPAYQGAVEAVRSARACVASLRAKHEAMQSILAEIRQESNAFNKVEPPADSAKAFIDFFVRLDALQRAERECAVREVSLHGELQRAITEQGVAEKKLEVAFGYACDAELAPIECALYGCSRAAGTCSEDEMATLHAQEEAILARWGDLYRLVLVSL